MFCSTGGPRYVFFKRPALMHWYSRPVWPHSCSLQKPISILSRTLRGRRSTQTSLSMCKRRRYTWSSVQCRKSMRTVSIPGPIAFAEWWPRFGSHRHQGNATPSVRSRNLPVCSVAPRCISLKRFHASFLLKRSTWGTRPAAWVPARLPLVLLSHRMCVLLSVWSLRHPADALDVLCLALCQHLLDRLPTD